MTAGGCVLGTIPGDVLCLIKSDMQRSKRILCRFAWNGDNALLGSKSLKSLRALCASYFAASKS